MAKWPRFTNLEIDNMGQLWVTSVAGTALVVIVQAIGEDWSAWTLRCVVSACAVDWPFTMDRLVRYLFAVWFGLYLLLAYLANEARPDASRWGHLFDVTQSIATFSALAALGFVTQNFGLFAKELHLTFITAFGAIGFIAVYTFFRHLRSGHANTTPEWRVWRNLQVVRVLVAVVTVVAMAYEFGYASRTNGAESHWCARLIFLVLVYAGLYAYALLAFQGRASEAGRR